MGNDPRRLAGDDETLARLTAGKQALRAGLWPDAKAAFESVLAVDETPEACIGLGEALWWLGHTERSVDLYERSYVGFRRAGEPLSAAWAAIWLALSYGSDFGNAAAFRGWLSRAERLLPDSRHATQGWLWLVKSYGTSDPEASQGLARQAFDIARETGDLDLELSALAHLGKTLVAEGRTAEGLALVDEAMAGAFGAGCRSLVTVVFTSCSMIVACELAADIERATQWCTVIDRFISDHGCPFLHAQCRVGYGGILVATGRWAEAEQQFDEAIRITRFAYPPFRAQALTRLADLRLDQGRLEEAEELLRRVGDSPEAALASARIHLARGRASVAIALLRRRIEASADRTIEAAQTLLLLVEALLSEKSIAAAEDTAWRLRRLALRSDHPLMTAEAARAWAQVRIARGEIEAGQEQLERALALYSDLPLPLEAALVRLELARILAQSQPEVAIAEARQALKVFELLGARPHADSAASVLRSLGVSGRSGKRKRGPLTVREQEVFQLLCAGLSNPVIAERLRISRKTAAHHVSNVLAKLDLSNRAQAAAYGSRSPDRQAEIGSEVLKG